MTDNLREPIHVVKKATTKKHFHGISITTLAAILAIGLLATVSAAYIITSNHYTGTPRQELTIQLSANITTPDSNATRGDTVVLKAQLSEPKPNIPIIFINNDSPIMQTQTDTLGKAQINYIITDTYNIYAQAQIP